MCAADTYVSLLHAFVYVCVHIAAFLLPETLKHGILSYSSKLSGQQAAGTHLPGLAPCWG